ncbi:hypothetical protein JQ662_000226 [Listeria monocytogenes]|nr:hypothetical protein [Listeria monocytogenes]
MEKVMDIHGKEIKFHDVVRTSVGEILLVISGKNKHTEGLAVVNDFAGIKDWIDVYPDGELEILGNADFSYED